MEEEHGGGVPPSAGRAVCGRAEESAGDEARLPAPPPLRISGGAASKGALRALYQAIDELRHTILSGSAKKKGMHDPTCTCTVAEVRASFALIPQPL